MRSVRQVLEERSQSFERGRNQYQSLNSVQTLEPSYKPQGGPPYKTQNVENEKKEALLGIRDQQQHHNRELAQTVNNELSNPDFSEEKKALRDYDIQELLDEGINEHNKMGNEPLYSNKEINQYLYQHGIDPSKSRNIEKPLDKETVGNQNRDGLPQHDVMQKGKAIEQDKTKSWEVNKQDLDIDHDPEI